MNPEEPIPRAAYAWPTVELDPVSRMRILAAGLPHVAIDETVFDVSFERLWSFIADLEANVPRFETAVRRLHIAHRDGDRLRLETRTPMGLRVDFDCVLRPGWCVMSSSRGQVGMAARPEGEARTRFVHFERSSFLPRLGRPFFEWNVRQDFRRIRALVGEAD